MNQVAEFYRRELTQALNEQAFGFSCSEIIRSTENEAEANITLLEGNTINAVLSSAGHRVWRQHFEASPSAAEVTVTLVDIVRAQDAQMQVGTTSVVHFGNDD